MVVIRNSSEFSRIPLCPRSRRLRGVVRWCTPICRRTIANRKLVPHGINLSLPGAFTMRKTRLVGSVLAVLLALAAIPAQAEVKLAPAIGNNMVLQRDKDLPIWGWDAPG